MEVVKNLVGEHERGAVAYAGVSFTFEMSEVVRTSTVTSPMAARMTYSSYCIHLFALALGH